MLYVVKQISLADVGLGGPGGNRTPTIWTKNIDANLDAIKEFCETDYAMNGGTQIVNWIEESNGEISSNDLMSCMYKISPLTVEIL